MPTLEIFDGFFQRFADLQACKLNIALQVFVYARMNILASDINFHKVIHSRNDLRLVSNNLEFASWSHSRFGLDVCASEFGDALDVLRGWPVVAQAANELCK
jgi:hypothetical protein